MTIDRQRIRAAAKRSLGTDQLRAGQTDAIAAILDGHDVLAVMATGYGKSAIFQTVAAMLDGVTVVVSPLIALQQDQVESLRGLEGRSAPVAAATAARPVRDDIVGI
ncbi:MAG: DEAD/DEAH box helicase [Rhodococcus sp. (in: high G+C Gram-positive bacteria)]